MRASVEEVAVGLVRLLSERSRGTLPALSVKLASRHVPVLRVSIKEVAVGLVGLLSARRSRGTLPALSVRLVLRPRVMVPLSSFIVS